MCSDAHLHPAARDRGQRVFIHAGQFSFLPGVRMEERPRTAREWVLGVLSRGSHIPNQGHSQFSIDFLDKWVVWGLSPAAGASLPGKGAWTMARTPFLTVSTALSTLSRWRDTVETLQHRAWGNEEGQRRSQSSPASGKLAAVQRGGCLLLPRTGRLAGGGRDGPSSKGKGPDGNGSCKDLLDLLGQRTPSPCATVPKP